jgi:hypothetical protein
MLSSYAAHDHRKICDQEKKACIVFPAPANESAETEWMVTYPIAEAIARYCDSAFAEGISVPPFLF